MGTKNKDPHNKTEKKNLNTQAFVHMDGVPRDWRLILEGKIPTPGGDT